MRFFSCLSCRRLKRDPENCAAVFRQIARQNKGLEQGRGSVTAILLQGEPSFCTLDKPWQLPKPPPAFTYNAEAA
jgi:hypothetical protein